MKLFRSVKFYLPETLPQERRSDLALVIESNGGQKAQTIHSATHIITNSYRFQGWQDVPQGVEIVTDLWVDRTMILGQLLPCEFYSADPGKVFSGVVGCASGISANDLHSLEAGVKALGGQWRHGLTKDVTHLFAMSPDSDKYATAMHNQESTHIKVLLPHWRDDAARLGSGNLSTIPYEWPDPKVLHPLPSSKEDSEGKKERAERSSRKMSAAKRTYYKTAIWDPDKGGQFPAPAEPVGEEIWGGRKVLLSPSLGLEADKRHALEEAVEAAGGLILHYAWDSEDGQEEEENERVSECDVLVTRWRAGKAFFKAIEEGKVVGTLNWVFYVHATGILSSPMDQLLHYPVRKGPVQDNFARHQITVTNYTGEARDYLKRLIHTMGATFTPNMTGSNSVLIAAHMGGIKTEKAISWNIPVVNHVWLEDCFVQWRDITPAVHKYIDFPPNLDFAPILGERGLMLTMEVLGTEEDEDIMAREQRSSERPPVGTGASAREVEGILEEGDVIMDDQDALETEERLPSAASRSKRTSERRIVSASVSPSKYRSTDEEDMMHVDPVPQPPKSAKRSKLPALGGGTKTSVAKPAAKRGKQPQRSDGDVEAKPPAEPARKSTDRKGKARQLEAEDEEDSEIPAAKAKPKGKEKSSNRVMFAPETETDSAGPSNSRASKSTTSKRKAQLMESASNDDQPESPPPKKRAKADKVSGTATGEASSSSGNRKTTAGPGRDSALRKTQRTESVRALADERVSAAKAGSKKQPAGTSSTAGKSQRSSSDSAKKTTTRGEAEEDDDEVMPDVVNYELEGRAQRSRGSAGKKRDEVDSADEMPPPKATKAKRTPKNTPKKDTPNTSSGSRGSRKSAATIKIMTTTVSLSDSVLKALSKLGVKTATQVSECTHLIAPGLVRTEKLLCALASGAVILSEKWAIESAAANKLLPEEDYILRDKANERKWHFRLVDAMARAKEVGGKLFENRTFYVTSKVPVDTKLLKTVVTIQGGKLSTQMPTVRILNSAPGRYVISCPEDISIWRPLAKDHVIYSQELLLTAALTQQIDWENPAFQVTSSA